MTKENWQSEAVLSAVKQLAGLHFTPQDIAIMIAVDYQDKDYFAQCMAEDSEEWHELYIAYHSGRLEEEVKIRQAIFLAAKQGSPPAQNTAAKIIIDTKLKNKGL